MPVRRSTVLAAALAGAAVVGAALPVSVAHAEVGALYVDNASGVRCSDAGAGTQALPFCTVQAAADVVQPGQTVLLGGTAYDEQVVLTRSGTPGNPIVFAGSPASAGRSVRVGASLSGASGRIRPHAFVVNGVHDITIRNLDFNTAQEAVLVSGSDRVTIDGNLFTGVGGGAGLPVSPAVRLAAGTTAATVSRNRFDGAGTFGVAVDAGVAGTVVTTNIVNGSHAGGISVTDAPGTVVTGNTVADHCRNGIELDGASSGATVENNLVTADPATMSCEAGVHPVAIAVSAGSTAGTKADYNVVVTAGYPPYLWGGTAYGSTFTAATGQGAHDGGTEPCFDSVFVPFAPTCDWAVADAADALAPGRLSTDVYGRPRVDDPTVPDKGTGDGHDDIGAVEVQDPFTVQVDAYLTGNPNQPLEIGIGMTSSSPWAPSPTGTLDFGDGKSMSGPLDGFRFPLRHVYDAPGNYIVTLTATDSLGLTKKSTYGLDVKVPPMTASVGTIPYVAPGHPYQMMVGGSASSLWPVTSYRLDLGDGTPVSVGPQNPRQLLHDYPGRGLYTVSLQATDSRGRTATGTTQVQLNGDLPGDLPVAGKWAKGRPSTVGMFNSGQWVLRDSNTAGPATMTTVWLGQAGDLPTVADWDGAGHDQLGIYRQGVFALRHESGSVTSVPFGAPGDVPVPGYWDHNGHAQLAIYRPSISTFVVRHDDGSVSTAALGNPWDVPLVGDWDGVGHTQMGIYRPGDNTFALRHDNGSLSASSYGAIGDQPVVGDWLGKGRSSYGIFRRGMTTYALRNAYAGQPDSVTKLY
ncbi:PKD domain-containing protein [Kitasatospora sp. YST-16]|uniref:PKD domain-containing protein n=1 Tax=Kitasatospora sp. YST-16 TaxID=2998080 RepID=UPI002283C330|nr:PKD domain-containing protein [Kitasatospora sp. YST-16]WAL72983.1 PKD domain-containing protein [Kitasatospora sp. YST-16]WNW39032.1 PKD domain-containing protein [Streptomyces sp. Li-HN-5-13]